MARVTDSVSGISFGWADGADNWGGAVNQTFQKLAYRGLSVGIKDIVSTPPSLPMPGDKYIIDPDPDPGGAWGSFRKYSIVVWGADAQGSLNTATPPTTDYAWRAFYPQNGWLVYNEGTTDADRGQNVLVYTGASDGWSVVGGAADAITSITSDDTLTGDGGATTPLSVATPFTSDEKAKLTGLAANRQLPAGGTQYQILEKTAATDYAVGWVDAPEAAKPLWATRRVVFSGVIGGPRPPGEAYSPHNVPIMQTPLDPSLANMFNPDTSQLFSSQTTWPMLGVYCWANLRDALVNFGGQVEIRFAVSYLQANVKIDLVADQFRIPGNLITGIVESQFLPCYVRGVGVGTWITNFVVEVQLRTTSASIITIPAINATAYAGVYNVERSSSRGSRTSFELG